VTPDQITRAVVGALCDIAPEIDPAHLRRDADLRDELDIDSMDFLNFIVAVHEQLEVDIPEADYEQLQTIEDIVAYVAVRLPPT
jgi:acyl carrier protein